MEGMILFFATEHTEIHLYFSENSVISVAEFKV